MFRTVITFFFVYLTVEGAFRKWFFPEISSELFILKDVILMLGVVALFMTNHERTVAFFRSGELAAWLLWIAAIVGYFLLRDTSLAGIAGLRYYLAPLPLMLLVPFAIGNIGNLRRAALGIIILTIPLCILGIVQYVSPVNAEINRYAWITAEDDISTFGIEEDNALLLDIERPRITATFSYIATYAAYLSFVVLVAWTVLAAAWSTRTAILASFGLLMIFTNLAMTGSRGPLGIAILLSLPFAYQMLKKGITTHGVLIAILLVPAFSFVLVYTIDALGALALRTESAGDTGSRALGLLILPAQTVANIDWLGQGIGATFGGMAELGKSDAGAEGFDELSADRVGVELGYVGYLYVLFLKCLFLAKGWSLYRACARDPELQVWALMAFAIQLSSGWAIPFHNAVAGSFYFAGIGLFLWVRSEYERRARARVHFPGASSTRSLAAMQNARSF